MLVELDEVVCFHELKKILTFERKFNEIVVKEYYLKILKNIAQMRNPFRWRTFIRVRLVTFSPSVVRDWFGIDEAFEGSDAELTIDVVARELIGRNLSDQVDKLSASKLTQKYKIIFKILLNNLDHITHRSDLSHRRVY